MRQVFSERKRELDSKYQYTGLVYFPSFVVRFLRKCTWNRTLVICRMRKYKVYLVQDVRAKGIWFLYLFIIEGVANWTLYIIACWGIRCKWKFSRFFTQLWLCCLCGTVSKDTLTFLIIVIFAIYIYNFMGLVYAHKK